MIYKITGKLIMAGNGVIAVDVHGVAYEIFVPLSSMAGLPNIGEDVSVFTHFVMREDGASLYGFQTIEEKGVFLQLNTVSKIGPKSALAILGSIGMDELGAAIVSADVERLSRVPGIGKRTAERLIVELKDKIKVSDNVKPLIAPASTVQADVISALVNLGYKPADCDKIIALFPDENDFQTLFRNALAKLGK